MSLRSTGKSPSIILFLYLMASLTSGSLANKSSFSNALKNSAISSPEIVEATLFFIAVSTFFAEVFQLSCFLHLMTYFWWSECRVLRSSIMILSSFYCFSKCCSSSLERGSSMATRTYSSIASHSTARCNTPLSECPPSSRQNWVQAKAGLLQPSEQQKRTALLLVIGHTGL